MPARRLSAYQAGPGAADTPGMVGRRTTGLAVLLLLQLAGPAWAGGEGTRIVLDDGSVIPGQVVGLEDDIVVIESESLGRLRVPGASVRWILPPTHSRPRHVDALDRRSPSAARGGRSLEIGSLTPETMDREELLRHALSIHTGQDLPAKIAE